MEQYISDNLQTLINNLKNKKVLLVCGKSFDKLDISNKLKPLHYVRFSNFSPNPSFDEVCAGIELYNKFHCQAILAVGGGSAIDVAKCIKLFDKTNPLNSITNGVFEINDIILSAIPTTAGTGSESTKHAVIYYKGEKQSISHFSILPEHICLIPSVLKSLPAYQKKCTLLDALCQSIESWWSVNATEESMEYSRISIKLIKEHWKEYIETSSESSAEKIMHAANYSGKAINITATTAPHAMSYKLTSLYGIPHGHAVAISLPDVWEYMLKDDVLCNDPRGISHLNKVFSEIPIDIKWFRDLLTALDITYPVSKNKAADIDILINSVNPVRLKNNPVFLDKDTIKSIYERIVL